MTSHAWDDPTPIDVYPTVDDADAAARQADLALYGDESLEQVLSADDDEA